jgi:hypothetical protein
MQKIWLPLLLVLSLSASCKSSDDDKDSSSFDYTLANVTERDFDVLPTAALTFETNIEMINFSSAEQEKMDHAIEIIKLVVATEEFKNRVLNHTFNGSKTFVDNGGYSNAQIYQMILDGAEKLSPYKNNTIDAEVELYYASTNVIGYTYPSSKRIWVNTKYFNSYTAAGVAHNLMHEWLHKLGFTHSSSWTASRSSSVPYAIGYMVGEIGKSFL